MFTYEEVRERVKTGDVALVEGMLPGSVGIRVLTGQQISHVGLFIWQEDGLWVYEFTGRTGFRAVPASQWVKEHERDKLYWGRAPRVIRDNPEAVVQAAQSFRGGKYSFWTLVTVWWAQILRRPVKGKIVCSTFVQKVWEALKYHFSQTPDPGDFMRHCVTVTPFC